MIGTFATFARRKGGGYSLMATCRCERNALRLARKLSRLLGEPSRVYSTKSNLVYCGELKRWVRLETAIVADANLSAALTSFSAPALNKGLDQIQQAL